jgi:putative transposase
MVGAVNGQEMVKRQRGHRARLELTGAQVAALDEQGSAAITVWNCPHAYWTHFAGKRPTLAQADAAIRQARTDAAFLAVLPAQAVLKTYVQAWENFFNPNHPAKRPTFKTKKGRPRLAVDVPQARNLRIVRLSAKWGAVTVPLVGRVRFRWTKALPGIGKNSPAGRVTGARLVKETGGWHIVFRTEQHVPQPAPHRGPKVGLDRGITVPLALSTGDKLRHKPWLTAGERERLLRLERTAARWRAARTRGEPVSNRLAHTDDQVAGLRAKAKRRAYDWQHQMTTALARQYSAIVVEDLHIANMMRSASAPPRPRAPTSRRNGA